MSPAIDAAVVALRFPWWTSAFLLLTTILYARGFARVHRQMPARFTLRRFGYYLSGIVALAIALVSPLEALDDKLLITHMLQHLLLMMIAPPLLLLSYPLHPPQRPNEMRTAHFPQLQTSSLFVHGSRDGFGSIDEMTLALKLIPALSELLPIAAAGHELMTKRNRDELPSRIVDAFRSFL